MFSSIIQGFVNHIFIIVTIVFTAYGQLVMKSQASKLGAVPQELGDIIEFIFRILTNPWIISALVAALLGMFSWLLALRQFNLSYAYPFYSSVFIIVILLSYWIFNEPLSLLKFIGVIFIMIGIILVGQSA